MVLSVVFRSQVKQNTSGPDNFRILGCLWTIHHRFTCKWDWTKMLNVPGESKDCIKSASYEYRKMQSQHLLQNVCDGCLWNSVGMKYSWLRRCGHFGKIHKGMDQGRAKIGYNVPSIKKTSSSDRKATSIKRMKSNDQEACEKKCCYFWFHSDFKFLRLFDVFLLLSHFAILQCNFYWF